MVDRQTPQPKQSSEDCSARILWVLLCNSSLIVLFALLIPRLLSSAALDSYYEIFPPCYLASSLIAFVFYFALASRKDRSPRPGDMLLLLTPVVGPLWALLRKGKDEREKY